MIVKDMRKEKEMSQLALAKEVGTTQPTICQIESGKRRPSVPLAKRLGAVLGFDWTLLFKNDEAGRDDE